MKVVGYERICSERNLLICRLLWPWFVMNAVCYRLNVVCCEWVCYERVSYELCLL